jgi:hypothetical protein
MIDIFSIFNFTPWEGFMLKKILLIILSLFVWSCEKDKDNNDSPSYSACEFGGEQALVSSFPFSDNGSTENLDNNF